MKYIGIVGVNGYGVYTDSKMALKSKPFVKEYGARFFTSPERAIKWVTNQYNKLQGNDKGMFTIEQIQQLNWFYHRK